MRALRLLGGMALIATVAACGAFEPFIFNPDEFNRNAKTFGKEPGDRTEVTICFTGIGTTDRQVERLAAAECERFGRTARPTGEDFGHCPLFTPIGARFDCVKPPKVGTSAGDDWQTERPIPPATD